MVNQGSGGRMGIIEDGQVQGRQLLVVENQRQAGIQQHGQDLGRVMLGSQVQH